MSTIHFAARFLAALLVGVTAASALRAQPAAAATVASAPMRGVVVDADGIVLGPYMAEMGSIGPAALVGLGGLPVAILLAPGKNHLQGTPFYDVTLLVPKLTTAQVFFKSGNCSGKAFIENPVRYAHQPFVVVGPAPSVVIADEHGAASVYLPRQGPPRLETVSSNLTARYSGRPICRQTSPFPLDLLEVDQVIDLSTVYKTPYHLE